MFYVIVTPEKDYKVESDIIPRKGDILDIGEMKTFKVISVRINLKAWKNLRCGTLYKVDNAIVEVE